MRASRSEPAADSPALAFVSLVLLCTVCYLNSMWGVFQFDDYKVIVEYDGVHSWQAWVDGLGQGIRPLLKLSYMLNWISGGGVRGFHLVNISIHVVNAWLVYRLAQEYLAAQSRAERLHEVPLLAALLFAAHPIHTEAVTYISGRSSSLMALFYLSAVLVYARARKRHGVGRVYWMVPTLFVAALAVKETAVTLPLALLLWEFACAGNWRTALRRQWPCWCVLLAAGVFFLVNDSYFEHMRISAESASLPGNAATQLNGLVYLLQQWLMPVALNIDPDLPLKADFKGLAAPVLFVLVVVVCMIGFVRARPWISFALAWALLHTIALHLLLPRLDVANERQMLLAGWPLLLAFAIELTLWLRLEVVRLLVAILALALAGLTVFRNQVYASEIALWQDTVAKSPQKSRVHNNLGYAYVLANRREAARTEFDRALELDPKDVKARGNLMRLDMP